MWKRRGMPSLPLQRFRDLLPPRAVHFFFFPVEPTLFPLSGLPLCADRNHATGRLFRFASAPPENFSFFSLTRQAPRFSRKKMLAHSVPPLSSIDPVLFLRIRLSSPSLSTARRRYRPSFPHTPVCAGSLSPWVSHVTFPPSPLDKGGFFSLLRLTLPFPTPPGRGDRSLPSFFWNLGLSVPLL